MRIEVHPFRESQLTVAHAVLFGHFQQSLEVIGYGRHARFSRIRMTHQEIRFFIAFFQKAFQEHIHLPDAVVREHVHPAGLSRHRIRIQLTNRFEVSRHQIGIMRIVLDLGRPFAPDAVNLFLRVFAQFLFDRILEFFPVIRRPAANQTVIRENGGFAEPAVRVAGVEEEPARRDFEIREVLRHVFTVGVFDAAAVERQNSIALQLVGDFVRHCGRMAVHAESDLLPALEIPAGDRFDHAVIAAAVHRAEYPAGEMFVFQERHDAETEVFELLFPRFRAGTPIRNLDHINAVGKSLQIHIHTRIFPFPERVLERVCPHRLAEEVADADFSRAGDRFLQRGEFQIPAHRFPAFQKTVFRSRDEARGNRRRGKIPGFRAFFQLDPVQQTFPVQGVGDAEHVRIREFERHFDPLPLIRRLDREFF